MGISACFPAELALTKLVTSPNTPLFGHHSFNETQQQWSGKYLHPSLFSLNLSSVRLVKIVENWKSAVCLQFFKRRFSTTKILHEINYGKFGAQKLQFWQLFRSPEFWFLSIWALLNGTKSKLRVTKKIKLVLFRAEKWSELISRKIRMAEKSYISTLWSFTRFFSL